MKLIDEEDPFNRAASEYFGIPYIYPYQRLVVSNIIEALTAGEESAAFRSQIVILPTGSGKTLCFTLPAVFTDGITLIVFPLLSLMTDQERRLSSGAFRTVVLKGGQDRKEREAIFGLIKDKTVRFVLTNPETLQSDKIRLFLKAQDIRHIVVDETHTVSEWGDSFRPAYLKLGEFIDEIAPTAVTAFTATASPAILKRITEIIFPEGEPHIIAVNPDRTNIYYSVIPVLAKTRMLSVLCRYLPRPILVFCSSRLETEKTARELRDALSQENIYFYHAGLSKSEKKKIEEWYFESRNGILTATCAYGMGVDKPDIRTVIHRSLPGSVEAYLQESGRGGRDRKPAASIVLYSPEERIKMNNRKDIVSRKRFENLVNYAEGTEICRREQLLRYFDSEPEDCDLCDYCRKEMIKTAPGTVFLEAFFKGFPYVFKLRDAALILKGYRTPWVRLNRWDIIKGFGTLSDWEMEDIEEMIRNGINLRILKTGRFPVLKEKISLNRKIL